MRGERKLMVDLMHRCKSALIKLITGVVWFKGINKYVFAICYSAYSVVIDGGDWQETYVGTKTPITIIQNNP